jgi:hypothetical protein
MILCNVLVLQRSLYDFLVQNIWWPLGLYIVMNVHYFYGENNCLCKFVVLTFYLVPIRLKMLFYLSLNFQNSFFYLNFFKKNVFNPPLIGQIELYFDHHTLNRYQLLNLEQPKTIITKIVEVK